MLYVKGADPQPASLASTAHTPLHPLVGGITYQVVIVVVCAESPQVKNRQSNAEKSRDFFMTEY